MHEIDLRGIPATTREAIALRLLWAGDDRTADTILAELEAEKHQAYGANVIPFRLPIVRGQATSWASGK